MAGLSFIVIAFLGLFISMDLISSTTAASLNMDISVSDFEEKLLAGLGIKDPLATPKINRDDIVIPDDIRSKYTSMLRAHRAKRMISKGIHKNPGMSCCIIIL